MAIGHARLVGLDQHPGRSREERLGGGSTQLHLPAWEVVIHRLERRTRAFDNLLHARGGMAGGAKQVRRGGDEAVTRRSATPMRTRSSKRSTCWRTPSSKTRFWAQADAAAWEASLPEEERQALIAREAEVDAAFDGIAQGAQTIASRRSAMSLGTTSLPNDLRCAR